MERVLVAPSLLAARYDRLGEEVAAVEKAGAEVLHLDIMDGHFVPNISFGADVVKAVRPLSGMFFDAHLMITDPLKYAPSFQAAGAEHITFHVEAVDNPREVIDEIHRLGCSAGISLKPRTPASAVVPFLDKVELVLVMTVEPGFGGQKFMADMMPKVAQLRAMLDEVNPDCELEVDGGVDTATRDACVNAGANVLVAGSAVYKAADIPAKIRALREG